MPKEMKSSPIPHVKNEPTKTDDSLVHGYFRKSGAADENVISTVISDLLHELPFAAIIYQPGGAVYDCNETACRMFGYSQREMRSLHYTNLLPDKFLTTGLSAFPLDVTTKGEFLWVCRRHKDGSIFQCEHSSKLVRLHDMAFYFSFYRRTESGGMMPPNPLMKNALVESPRINAPICVFTWQEIDGQLRIVGYNPAMDEVTRGRIEQYVGCTAHELYEHRGRSDVIEVMYQIYRQKGILRYETFCDHLMPGNESYVDSVTFFMEPDLLIQFIEDITDRRQAVAELKRSEERFKALYVSSPIPVITWKYADDDFILIGYNNALEQLTNNAVAEMMGTPARIIFNEKPELCDDIRRTYEERTIVRRRAALRLGAKGDEKKHLAITHAYVPGDLVLTYIADITEQVQAEAEILRYQRQLSSLYEKQVDIIERERQRISQELHDGLGQYLSTIKLSTENLLVNNDAGIDRTLMDEQLRATIGLLKEAITDVSKISMDLRPSILDDLGIVATINWFLREFGTVYKTIRVDKDLFVDDAEIPQRIKIVMFRILQEAMSNIGQHSGADHVRIRMKKAGGFLEFTIRDNGGGFDVKELQKSCNGLGIAGMRERVSFSQGVFAVESKKGKGTTVRVRWPLSD
jgi:PAS domain S-box-containing protein